MITWVDKTIIELEASKEKEIRSIVDGQEIVMNIAQDLKVFLLTHKDLLIRIGKTLFKLFLSKIIENKEEEAFNILKSKMSNQDLIDRMNQNADILKSENDSRDEFWDEIYKFATNQLLKQGAKILLAILL